MNSPLLAVLLILSSCSPIIHLVDCLKTASVSSHHADEQHKNDRLANNNNGHPICVSVPNNLSFCHSLGWGNKMRLPNILEHETIQEVQLHMPSWQQLYNTKCSPDLSLFICSILTPVCLDIIVPPCRSLCLSVKGRCEPIMKRYDHSWPKIVDCNKFPINKDMCISQQTKQQHQDTTIETSNDRSIMNVSMVDQASSDRKLITHSDHINSVKRKKTKKNRPNSRKNSTISNEPNPQPFNTSFATDQIYDIPKSKEDQKISTTSPTHRTIEFVESTPIVASNETYSDQSYTNQSNVDFIKLFCSTQSEWLIKTKISDLQLFRAQDKRKLKLRYYKQIYGQIGSFNSNKNAKNTSNIVVHLTNRTLALTYNKKSIHSSLFDNLVTSSPITSYPAAISSGSNSSNTHNLTQFYLLAGKTSKNQQRLITMWMLWPRKDTESSQSKDNRLPNINQNLLQDYKEIKKRGSKVCNKFSDSATKHSRSTIHQNK